MLYAFCFLGEFGYELFNWQGLVRKFRHTLTNGEKIAACSRMGMDIWYDVADYYLDISEVKLFKKSIASMYSAYNNIDNIDFAPEFEDELKYALHCHIVSQLNIKYGKIKELSSNLNLELKKKISGLSSVRTKLSLMASNLDLGKTPLIFMRAKATRIMNTSKLA